MISLLLARFRPVCEPAQGSVLKVLLLAHVSLC